VVPASILMPELREGIRQHRAALIDDVLAHPDLPCRCIDCGAVLPAPYKWRCPDCLAAMGVK
jgi:hypothetical protein